MKILIRSATSTKYSSSQLTISKGSTNSTLTKRKIESMSTSTPLGT
jgi:hypothetical protein